MNHAAVLSDDAHSVEGHRAPAPGGLPAAVELAAYERAVPGSGERLLAMAERSLELQWTRVTAEEARLEAAGRREHVTWRIAQISIAVVSLAAVCIGSGLLFLSESWFGGLVALGVPTVSMAALAVMMRRR